LPPDFAEKPEIYTPFFEIWNDIRERWGEPIIINSGYRCPPYNRDVGGEACSAHCTGFALDIRPIFKDDIGKLSMMIEEYAHDLRMKVYNSWIHIDAAWLCVPRLRDNWVKGYRFRV